jgi:[acyl-carrier-protein] S-malonyltransferase
VAVAYVFPGQGSQAVGMGKSLSDTFPEAAAVFAEVDAALGQHLSRLIFAGPEADLTLTSNAQPALMAVSLAVVRVLEARGGLDLKRDARFVAGHSLGEYSALAAAGSLSISTAARLLRRRGDAMQQAVPVGAGAMAAVIGLDSAAVAAVVAQASAIEGAVCDIANDNGGGQVVISGATAAVVAAIDLAKAKGAKRVVALPVSAPFHCHLMQPAADAMAAALAEIELLPPAVPIIVNVLAAPISDPAEIRRRLIEQVTGTVRWRETILFMAAEGVHTLVELGAGRVLTGLTKRITDNIVATALGSASDIQAWCAVKRDGGDRV